MKSREYQKIFTAVNEMQKNGEIRKAVVYYDMILERLPGNDWRRVQINLWKALAMAKLGKPISLVMINTCESEAKRYGIRYLAVQAGCFRVCAQHYLSRGGVSETRVNGTKEEKNSFAVEQPVKSEISSGGKRQLAKEHVINMIRELSEMYAAV